MSYEIKKVTGKSVEFDPPLASKNPTRVLPPDKFGVTDKAIALVEGNQFEKGAASQEITAFGPALRADTGPVPAIDRNPYNFVAFAGNQPWFTANPAGHDDFQNLNGYLEFEAESLTPCFVPAGFPFAPGDPKPGGDAYTAEDLREISREFCSLRDSEGKVRYAIPGASFKGALRAAVEAIANSRMGVADEKKLEQKHLYRRRVFTCGMLNPSKGGDWEVQQVEFREGGYGGIPVDNRTGLLAWFRKGKPTSRSYQKKPDIFRLSKALAEAYRKNISTHPHYERHHDENEKEYVGLPPDWREELATLHDGDIVYCAVDPKTKEVLNFGKNVNYLWPALRSWKDLVKPFLPRESPDLDRTTDLAEQLFGFTSDHEKGHPFRGLLRFETLWGDEVASQATELIRLAPLTAPASQGKSRPLYLAPGPDGLSASFDDPVVEARGRKFYWHQRAPGGKIWAKHTFEGSPTHPVDTEFRRQVQTQCPAPIHALPAGVMFRGRIHFSNLGLHGLGALLFALEGDGTYDHSFHLGKAKARGLGSFRIKVTNIVAWRIAKRYASLSAAKGKVSLTSKRPAMLGAFREWCEANARAPKDTPLRNYPHIQDFVRLHHWPGSNSVRYYPPNFSQYSWLPGDYDAKGEPQAPRRRPRAMKRARGIEP